MENIFLNKIILYFIIHNYNKVVPMVIVMEEVAYANLVMLLNKMKNSVYQNVVMDADMVRKRFLIIFIFNLKFSKIELVS